MNEAKQQKPFKNKDTTATQATEKQARAERKKGNAESTLARRQDAANREIFERLKLSKLDTVFLFTFTVTTIILTYLSTLIKTLGPFLPLLVISFSIYPYYIGIWHGMIYENIPARIFAWKYLVTQFTILLGILVFTPLALLLAPLATSQSMIPPSLAEGGIIFLVGIFSAVLTVVMAATLIASIEKAFNNTLTVSKREASKEALRKANLKYSRPAIILNPLTMTIEFFAIQDSLTAIGTFTQNVIPPNPASIILTYLVLAYFTYDAVKPTPKKTEKKHKDTTNPNHQNQRKAPQNQTISQTLNRKLQGKTARRALNIRRGKTHRSRHQKSSNK